MFFSYDANEMNFRFGEVFVGYVANGTVVRKSNSENGSFLRSADANIAENGK